MNTLRTRILAALIALAAFCLGLYVLRDARTPLATLAVRSGSKVERDHAQSVGAFSATEKGAQFFEGDGLRTGPGASAELETESGSRVLIGENSTVRFTSAKDGSDQAIGLDIAMGMATIRASDKKARIHTHVGLAVLDEHSEVVLTRHDAGLELDVRLGTLRFDDQHGEAHVVGDRDPLLVGIGMAVVGRETRPVIDGPRVNIQVTGDGVVQRRGGEAPSTLTAGDHTLPRGTLLKLTNASQVRVQHGDGSVVLEAPGSYRLDGQGNAVEALSGIMHLLAWSEDVRVAVPGGVIVARGTPGGSEAEVWLTPEGGDVRVLRGEAELEQGGEHIKLGKGEEQSWPKHRSETGKTTTLDSLPFAHLEVRAGDSFVVHAPGTPLSIGFALGKKCEGPAELELANGKRRVVGEGVINAAFAVGATNYQVRCGKTLKARGRVTLLLDAGTRKLPTRAPVSDIDADGRAYSIYYQNQLPEIRVRWPQAPASGPYVVEADGVRHELREPTFLFSSGMLGDGPHTVVWSAGKRKSRPALVDIHYDNAAATASLTEPEDRGFATGDTVRVRGEALRAWKVELENGTIERDAHDRFAGERVTTRATPDITVRLSHPRHGVHYYVRRSLESP